MTIAIATECMKLALAISSPSVNDRKQEVVNIAKFLYSNIQEMVETPKADTPRRGRPPKPCA